MKTLNIIGMMLLVWSIQAYGQADVLNHTRVGGYYVGWDAGGSSGSLDIKNDFSDDIDFYTSTTQKATVLANGNVGIGIAAPVGTLQINQNTGGVDGSILAIPLVSATLAPPISGAGSRFMWYADYGALRAGLVSGSQWDQSNTGQYSVAFGDNTEATDYYAVAIGTKSIASNTAAFASGAGSLASGFGSFAAGLNSIASGLHATAFGGTGIASFPYSTVFGYANLASATNSMAIGNSTTASSFDEFVIGTNNLIPVSPDPATWKLDDPIFQIGIGTSNPQDALTVLKDGRTGIGLTTFPPLTTVQLHVERKTDAVAGTTTATAGYFDAENTWNASYAIGVQGYGRNVAGVGCAFVSGGRFFAFGGTNGATGTQGVFGYGIGAKTTNWGGYFEAAVSPVQNPQNVGVSGIASRAKFNVGVYGYAPSPLNGTVNYGVWGDIGRACPGFPAGPPCPTGPDYAGYFTGDVISLTNFFQLSDENYKDNVQDITNPMNILSQLNPKTYTYKQQDNPSMNLAGGTHYGLLAQELENVLPDLVKNSIHPARYDSLGDEIFPEQDFKAVSYIELIPFLIAAIKEQQQTMEAMQAELATLNGGGNRHANPGSGDENSGEEEKGITTSIDVELSNA